jgi:hypothetical protein
VTTAEIDIDAPASTAHAVIIDPGTYPEWLVGAKRIRSVDEEWPAVGSSFHHAVGAGPLTVHDRTTVLEHPDETTLLLEARIGPLGAARVRFLLSPLGDEQHCHLAIEEEPAEGPARLLWRTPARPLVAAALWGRNAASLDSLKALVEDRWQAGTTPVSEQTGPV